MFARRYSCLAALATLSACASGSPAGPQALGEGTRILFIGNSLTYVTGSYLAALVMYARIRERTPVGLPAKLRTRDGVTVTIAPALARTLQEAAASVTVGSAVR